MSDVDATIGLARLLRKHQPRLFDYAFAHRTKSAVTELLNVRQRSISLLASLAIPGDRHHLGAVVPLCKHPGRSNAVIALDLDTPPELLQELDTDELRRRVFSRRDELGTDARIGLLSIKINACPVLAPLSTLRPADGERLGLDRAALEERRLELLSLLDGPLIKKIETVMTREFEQTSNDIDGGLYGGGFIGDADRRRLDALRVQSPADLAKARPLFDDPRLDDMLWRFRARNWPESLSEEETTRWHADVLERLGTVDAPWAGWESFDQAMANEDWNAHDSSLRDALQGYCDALGRRLGRQQH